MIIFCVLYSKGVYMPTIKRTCFNYCCYHIVTRGNQKQVVFREKRDYQRYLHIVKKAKKKYKIKLYAYCLMPNHVHQLIKINKIKDMINFMRWVNRGYTAFFNAKYEKVGHLWQGRYKSKPIVRGRYLFNCATYIEENPLRKKIIKDIADYKWSSYKERCLISKKTMLDEFDIF